VFIQCFEVGNLRALRRHCEHPLVQLMAGQWAAPGTRRRKEMSYAAMTTAAGLHQVAGYASAIGVEKTMVITAGAGAAGADATGGRGACRATRRTCVDFPRRKTTSCRPALRQGDDPAAHGDLAAEIRAHLAAGIDGLFCDFPALARARSGSRNCRRSQRHATGMKIL